MLDIPVAHILLDRPGIVSVIGQFVTSRMSTMS
jgi:hypothetical protein